LFIKGESISYVSHPSLFTTEELADEQRLALIDQYVHLQRLDAAFEFDLHDLMIILITILIIIIWRAWDRIDRWSFR
jgi:hypothetical protein